MNYNCRINECRNLLMIRFYSQETKDGSTKTRRFRLHLEYKKAKYFCAFKRYKFLCVLKRIVLDKIRLNKSVNFKSKFHGGLLCYQFKEKLLKIFYCGFILLPGNITLNTLFKISCDNNNGINFKSQEPMKIN